MDSDLIVQALNYHGRELRRVLDSEAAPNIFEDVDMRAVDYLQYHKRVKEFGFQERNQRQRLFKFIGSKAHLLYISLSGSSDFVQSDSNGDETYAVMPPFESYLGVSRQERRKCFSEVTKKGDPVIGTITAFKSCIFMINLICMDGGKCREIHDLGIKCSCTAANALVRNTHDNIFSSYHVKDLIRGAILKEVVNPDLERLYISMKSDHLAPQFQSKLKTGLITEEDLPIHYRVATQFKDKSYSEVLEWNLNFNNPTNIYQIGETLGLNVHKTESLFKHLYNIKYEKEEYASALRKLQSAKWAFSRIRDGVTQFKAGNHIEAYQCLNKALDIDPESVEGLVARGALFANNNNFRKAVEDFEKALEINPHHGNAQKYLSETLIAIGKCCQEKGDIEEACKNYKKAILISDNDEARNALVLLENNMNSKEVVSNSVVSSTNGISSMETSNTSLVNADTRQKLLFLLQDEKQKSHSKPASPIDVWNLQGAHKSSCEKDTSHRHCDDIPSCSNDSSYEEVKHSQQNAAKKAWSFEHENQHRGRNDPVLINSSDSFDTRNSFEKSLKLADRKSHLPGGQGDVSISLEERLKEFYKKVGEDDLLGRYSAEREVSCKRTHKLSKKTIKHTRGRSGSRGKNISKELWTEKYRSFKYCHKKHTKVMPFSDHSNASCKRIKNASYKKGNNVLKNKSYKSVNSENCSDWLNEPSDMDPKEKRDRLMQKPPVNEVHHKSCNPNNFHKLDSSLRTKEHYELYSRKSQLPEERKYSRKCRKSPCLCSIDTQSLQYHTLPSHHHKSMSNSSHKYYSPENKYHRDYDCNKYSSPPRKAKHSVYRLSSPHGLEYYRKDRGLICRAPDPEKLRQLKESGKASITKSVKRTSRTAEGSALAAAMAAAQKIEAALKDGGASSNESCSQLDCQLAPASQEPTLQQMELFLEKLKSHKKTETISGSKDN